MCTTAKSPKPANAVVESQIYFNRVFNTNCPVRSRTFVGLYNIFRHRVLNSFPERLQNDTPAGAPRHFCRNEQTRELYFFAFAHLIQKNCLKPRILRFFSILSPREFPNFFKLFPLNVYFKPFLAFCPMG